MCYDYGKGVEKDIFKGARFCKLSAAQGHSGAQYALGVCNDCGREVDKGVF